MTIESFIEFLYLATGLALPLFYIPQILRLKRDTTRIASFSLKKARWQFVLRIPALLFAIFVVKSNFMIVVLVMDLLGRGSEILMAMYSLSTQGFIEKHDTEWGASQSLSLDTSDPQRSR